MAYSATDCQTERAKAVRFFCKDIPGGPGSHTTILDFSLKNVFGNLKIRVKDKLRGRK